MHYQRWRRHGDTDERARRGPGTGASEIVLATKKCKRCEEVKSADLFPKVARARDGLHSWCKACMTWNTQRWRVNNPDYTDKRSPIGERRYSRRYGLEPEDYFALLQSQGGGCAICGTLPKAGAHGALHIDHDHTDGRVRGLLCRHCNLGLGNFKDDINRMTAAMAYLMQHTDVLGEVSK